MNAYEAKFAREAKANPADWVIYPNGRGSFQLICVAVAPIQTRPVLRLVE